MKRVSINKVIEENHTTRRFARLGLLSQMALASQALSVAGEKIPAPVLAEPKNKPFYRRFDRKKY